MTARAGLVLALLLGLAPATGGADESAVAAATEPVLKQLEAFRRGDFDTAYTFASESIHQQFDRAAFERMVTGGYPEIARSVFAVVAQGELAANGKVYLVLKIRGANGVSVEAVYELVDEAGAWKINGVVARPDSGII
ncbi:MAG TPA: DUF4864 domain-containing protein [Pseudomonadales bacterium]|nr:DUF4864 domain-containing protein [Pseudomonadales bacterium]